MKAFRSELDQDESRFVALRWEEGLSQREMASRLGRTRRWVRTIEVELRARLVGYLRDSGYLPAGRGVTAAPGGRASART
ncbi:MAG: sigma factor-like helix-turn-helix DNA-binding protein [Pseudomonadota bacterium]